MMKKSALFTEYSLVMQGCDPEDGTERERERNRKRLHTAFVERQLQNEAPHRLLQAKAPDVSATEQQLPRAMRRTLAQIRAMKGPLLRAWQYDIEAAEDPRCPLCGLGDHTTDHLFTCPNIDTELTPEDLWRRPGLAAELVQRWQDALEAAQNAEEDV